MPWIRLFPGGEYLTAVFSGIPNEEVYKRIYRDLHLWMDRHVYESNGPALEQFVVELAHMSNPDDFIIELQIPVVKVLTL